MYSSCTKSTIKNQNTQLTEKSVGITMRIFPDYPIEKSQYPINKKINSPKFLIWSSVTCIKGMQEMIGHRTTIFFFLLLTQYAYNL